MSMNPPNSNESYVVANGTSSNNVLIEIFENRPPTSYDINYQVKQRWLDKSAKQEYLLQNFTSSAGVLQANWILLPGGTGAVIELLPDTGTSPVIATAGQIAISGSKVAAGTNPVRTDGTATSTLTVEVQTSQAIASTDATKIGLAAFDSGDFTVDANGFVSLGGSGGAAVQTLTGDDSQVIIPTLGNISLTGVVVANATHAKPLYFVKSATSIEALDLQLSTAVTTQSDTTKAGISSFDTSAFGVSSNGWVTSKSGNTPGSSNLGVSYSGGTFTVTSANGGTLSSTNTAYVTFQNATNIGRLITMPVTNPYTFTDAAGTNEIGANLFGITTGIAWANDCPFYLYAVVNSAQTDVAFGFGRVPNLSIAPVAGKLAVAGTTAATTQGSLFLLKKNGATPTVADFASQPVVLLGSFRMQATLTPAWTVQALSAQKDGIGNFNETTTFTYPKNQNGAVAANHFLSVGGDTAPVWTNQDANYKITRLGQLNYFILYSVQTGNGSGTAPWKPTIPLQSIQASNQSVGWWASQAVNASSIFAVSLNADTSNCSLPQHGLAGGLTVGQFVSGGATGQFSFNLIYTASVL